jgi:DNA-directed RNA polymerase III subunit RPC8
MTVFRPFQGEIIKGRIKSSTPEGIVIDMEFTSEIFIPHQNLFENTTFSHAENCFIWNSDGVELFLDKGEPVHFRVEQEEWIDQRPTVIKKDDKGELIEERGTAWRVIVSLRPCTRHLGKKSLTSDRVP